MRLSKVLSSPCNYEFVEVGGFLEKKLSVGEQKEISIGKIRLNFYCEECDDTSTFWSSDELFCIGVNPRMISIDCVLKCECGSSVAIWFLVESYEDDIAISAPNVRILKRREKLLARVRFVGGQYTDYLDKAIQAYRDGLGAGSMVTVQWERS
jgi:hypothetical protein